MFSSGNALIIQSGGPTAVINSSLVGIIDSICQNSNIKIYGAKGGFQGLLENSFIRLDTLSKEKLDKIKHSPGAILGTCRLKIDENCLNILFNNLKGLNIRFLFCIGGNGTMYVTNLIGEYAQKKKYDLYVIGVPKSIDNDLYQIDHSPGYISAAKFLISCCKDITFDISSYDSPKKITIIETMGRNTGWLAASCRMASTIDSNVKQLIYIPEIPFDLEKCLEKVEKYYRDNHHTLLIVSEGIKNINGQFFSSSLKYDALKRPHLGGVSYQLKKLIDENLGLNTRNIDTSIWQRCGSQYISTTDLNEAYSLGYKAWELVRNQQNKVMISLKRKNESTYKPIFFFTDLENVAGMEKKFPSNWYNIENSYVTDDILDYLSPLLKEDETAHSIIGNF
nr:diphosphate--fructose-6-phosphate 1-phosphotransferase [Lysinibacillus telephonicus]